MKPITRLEDIDRPEGVAQPVTGWGSDVLARLLRDLDFKYIALVPGASFRGLHDSLVNHGGNTNPQMLVCLHEEHAVAIAQGWAKVTERPMLACLHSNVGLMHASMAVYNAWCDRVPVVILGATGPMDANNRRPWIEWIHTSRDQGALVRSFVKWDDQPGSVPAAIESISARAADHHDAAVRADLRLPRRRIAGRPDRQSGRAAGPDAVRAGGSAFGLGGADRQGCRLARRRRAASGAVRPRLAQPAGLGPARRACARRSAASC